MTSPKPRQIEIFPSREVGVIWSDGREDYFPAFKLRALCPCAECVDEISGQRTLDPATIAQSVRVDRWEPVGHYAVRFFFSDGHSVGMFTFESLRSEAFHQGP